MFKYNSKQLILGTGSVCVVTGWTLKSAIASKLNPEDYAAIGNLYSPTRGISPLIRNLLLNPHVRCVVGLLGTREDKNSGSVQALMDFFRNGFELGTTDTGRECWLIKSDVAAYIDIEIPPEVLELLREKVKFTPTYAIADCIKAVKESENFPSWGEPMEFPVTEFLPSVLPAPRYGHRIEGKTIAETWVKILHRIKSTGTIRPTQDGEQWQELIDLVAIVTDEPDGFYFADYLPCDRAFIENYIPQMIEDAEYVDGTEYTYGQRMRSWFGQDQIEAVINKLVAERDSARAVISLWDSGSGSPPEWKTREWSKYLAHDAIARYGRKTGDSDHDHGNPPCLNHIWVRVVGNELSLTATFRSNDMFGAWPANAMGLRALQERIRTEIETRSQSALTLGPLITVSQSAHLYSNTWESVDRIVNAEYDKIIRDRWYNDPSGSFVITTDNGKIIAEWISPGTGETVFRFEGKTSRSLYQAIAAKCPYLQTEHAIYLGTELGKAEISLKCDRAYRQDG